MKKTVGGVLPVSVVVGVGRPGVGAVSGVVAFAGSRSSVSPLVVPAVRSVLASGVLPVNIQDDRQHRQLSYIDERGEAPRRPSRNADAIQPEFRGQLGHDREGEDGCCGNEQQLQVCW